MQRKVILLNFPPALDFSYDRKGTIYPAAAILLIGTLLKKNGYEIHIIDGTYDSDYLGILRADIKNGDILYVGMSVMTTQIPFALEASRLIKRYKKDIPVVWGGAHATLFPEQVLKNENVDAVAINEGSFTAVELARCFANSGELTSVKGLAFKDRNGRLVVNPAREPENINELPLIDFSLLDVEKYVGEKTGSVYRREFPYFKNRLRIMPILTGLGCAYKCEFCINVILNRRYRFRSAESIVNEIKRLKADYDANTFLFLDEDFFINKRRTLEFISIIEKENLHFNLRAWCRVDHFNDNYLDRCLVRRLAKIGHCSIVMGGESGSQEILDYLRKGITVEQTINSLKVLSGTNIFPRYSFMIGLENENMAQIKDTYRLCMKMRRINPIVDIAGPFVFRLYPGSPIYNRIISKYNVKMPDSLDSWSDYLKEADTYTELPWVPKRLRDNMKLFMFYSEAAFSEQAKMHKNLKQTIKYVLFYLLPKIRLRYLFFWVPIEYYCSLILKKINKRRG